MEWNTSPFATGPSSPSPSLSNIPLPWPSPFSILFPLPPLFPQPRPPVSSPRNEICFQISKMTKQTSKGANHCSASARKCCRGTLHPILWPDILWYSPHPKPTAWVASGGRHALVQGSNGLACRAHAGCPNSTARNVGTSLLPPWTILGLFWNYFGTMRN